SLGQADPSNSISPRSMISTQRTSTERRLVELEVKLRIAITYRATTRFLRDSCGQGRMSSPCASSTVPAKEDLVPALCRCDQVKVRRKPCHLVVRGVTKSSWH